MAGNSGDKWAAVREALWSVVKPAIIAMIVALLVTLGVARPGGVQVQGVSHFSSVYSNDDVQAVDDLIAGDDVTVTDDITLSGALVAVESVSAADLVASDDVTTGDDVTVGDDLIVTDAMNVYGNISSGTGAVTVTDDLDVTGLLSVGTYARVAAETAISVTMNGYITPTGTLQALESAGTVATSNLAAGTAGNLLIMYNSVATTITITDTGTLVLGGNWAAGQYDAIWLWSDGTNWIEIGRSNN
jgi:hypothetical protein